MSHFTEFWSSASLWLLVVLIVIYGDFTRAGRLFAIGDLHGDLHNALRVFQLCNLTTEGGQWIGGDATLVQTGDVVDRGPDTLKLLNLLSAMQQQALASGGRIVRLLGNHEVMAFKGRLKYVHPDDLRSFGGAAARFQAFQKSGTFGYLRGLDSLVILNRTLFVHAGLTPELVRISPQRINDLVRTELQRERYNSPILQDNGPQWTRAAIHAAQRGECDSLNFVLRALESEGAAVDRMVVGHTIQHSGKITSYCNGSLVAIDISISSYNNLGADNIAAIEVITRSDGSTFVEVITPTEGEVVLLDHLEDKPKPAAKRGHTDWWLWSFLLPSAVVCTAAGLVFQTRWS
eukprot:RCo050547